MMLLGFISVSCLFTSIAGTANPDWLLPEVPSHGQFNPSYTNNNVTRNILSEATRPRPIENKLELQHQPCKNSEILVKILSILQKMISQDSSKGDVFSDVLNSVKENLKSDLTKVKSDEILNNLDDLEKLIEVDDGIPKPVLRQYTYRSAPGKLKTKIVFKYELPSISHPNCKEAFEKLIQTAHGAYLKLSNDPMCADNGFNQPNYNEINNREHQPFDVDTKYKLNPELVLNAPSHNLFNDDDSASPFNSIPQDFQLHMQNKLSPNNMFKYYNFNRIYPKIESVDQNPNGFEFLPDAAHNNGYGINSEMNQNNPWLHHPNITQNVYNISVNFPPNEIDSSEIRPSLFPKIYQNDPNSNSHSKFSITNDIKSNIPMNNNNIYHSKYPESIDTPSYDVPAHGNKINYRPGNNDISDILNKFNLGENAKNPTSHDNDAAPHDDNDDIIHVKDDELLFKQNNIYGPMANDSEIRDPNQKPNYQQYINEIKDLISQNQNHNVQISDNQNGVYDQDLTLNPKYFPNNQDINNPPLDSVPVHPNGRPYGNGNNPFQLNVNTLYQNPPPYQNKITVNKNGIYQINPNLNNFHNAATYYNGIPYIPKDLPNINGVNGQNYPLAHAQYPPDYLHYGNHQPIEENKLLNLQHLLSVTNLYKLNDLSHKADIIELTYMLKRSEPLVYQPFYIVKYRLPYTKFLFNLRDLILRKPYLRTNPEKLYQELIALSNVTETSDDLKGYPKEDIVKLTFNNGALVTAKILDANDTNINEQLKVIQNLNSNLQPEDFLKLNTDNANKYFRSGKNTSEPSDSRVGNDSGKAMRSSSYGSLQYQDRGRNIWNNLQQNNDLRPVFLRPNPNVINPRLVPAVVTSQQPSNNLIPMYQHPYGRSK